MPEYTRRDNIWVYGEHGFGAENAVAHQHPAIFPLQLAKDHIQTWSNPDDLILDPMCGSGTSLRAAIDLSRRAVGMEINPDYWEIIEARMAQAVPPVNDMELISDSALD